MGRRTIHRDRHGLYVRADGWLFRPQLSARSTRQMPVVVNGEWQFGDVSTAHTEGDRVLARHRGGSTFGKVGDEVWYSHGSSTTPGGARADSTEMWEPADAAPTAHSLSPTDQCGRSDPTNCPVHGPTRSRNRLA